jgi:DJ-1/PfpI family
MDSRKTVGTLLFEGFELLDVFGPLEAWGMLARSGSWRVVTTAASAGSVASAQGPRAVADYALTDCPKLDVIVVPGGIGTRGEVNNPALVDRLRQRSADAEVVSSVCTGASLLARAGLLDGRMGAKCKLTLTVDRLLRSDGGPCPPCEQPSTVWPPPLSPASSIPYGASVSTSFLPRRASVFGGDQGART